MSKEKDIPQIEDRAAFYKRLSNLPVISQEYIMDAYDFAKVVHHGILREGGERYFEHVRNVALIIIDECKINDPVMIASALLHDSAEDSQIYGSVKGKTNSEWRDKAKPKLSLLFGDQTSQIVMALTKPFIDGVEVLDKEKKDSVYHDQLIAGGAKAILVKMADRLHNLRTLSARSKENQNKIINETSVEYFPLFENIKDEYPNEVHYLLAQMSFEIDKLKAA